MATKTAKPAPNAHAPVVTAKVVAPLAATPPLTVSPAASAKTAPLKANAKRNRRAEEALEIRKANWASVPQDRLWLLDGKRGGFAQVPRTLLLLMNIIRNATVKNTGKTTAASSTYAVLWMHSYGEGIARIENEQEAAFEAGYGGERSTSTFRAHMKVLKDLGFLDYAPGGRNKYEWVLLFNPYQVLKKLKQDDLVDSRHYNAMIQRLGEIGSSKELSGESHE